MRRRLLTGVGIVAALLFLSQTAHAQFNQYNFPIERGTVESHVELQFQYSSWNNTDVGLISAEAQFAFGDLEVGINVPFASGWTSDLIDGSADWQLGDIMLSGKYKVLGFGKNLGIAVFGNFWLPTHSGSESHEFFQMAIGAAASVSLMGFEVGGGVQTRGTVWSGPDTWLLGFYGYARVPLFGFIAIQAALEYYNSLKPNGDLNSFTLTPGIEVSISKIYASIGSRIAITDDGKPVNLGRASLLMNGGFRW
jgi:hypothetical protein